MAKNVALIPGERSNWEVAFFLLIDEMVPFLKPNMNFDRQDIMSDSGMNFLHSLLSPIGYQLDKALEESLQGTINKMRKKSYILSDQGRYTLTKKGYDRLIEIREKYIPEKKEYIGNLKESIDTINSFSDEKCERVVSSMSPEVLKKMGVENINAKDTLNFIINKHYNMNPKPS